MMRNGTRLLMAAATGAAVFASGTASAFATQSTPFTATAAACDAVTTDISEVKVGDTFVPLKADNTVSFEATLKKPFKDKDANGAWPVEGNTKQVARSVTKVTAADSARRDTPRSRRDSRRSSCRI